MAKTKKQPVANTLQDLSKKEPLVENQEVVITKEAIEETAAEGVDLSISEPSITTYTKTGKLFITAREAYLHAYEHFPVFPANWFITENFTWNEAFANEQAGDGTPILEVFENVVYTAHQLQAIRNFVKKPINIHCWVRQIRHNKRAGSTAEFSPHINGRAVDFDITGYSTDKTIATASNLRLPIRVEAGTKGYCHIDTGNSYTNNYRWGIFYP